MGAFTLSLIIGSAIGLIVTVRQVIRIYTGASTKVVRNPDGSVSLLVPSTIVFFILWSLVFFVVALILVSLLNWIR